MRATIVLLLTVLTLAGLVGVARLAPPVVPGGDLAVIESFTIHAADGDLRVGPYSRFQWHHPGPAYFYVLAPFYVLSGHRTSGLSAGAGAINLAALGIILWTMARANSPRLAIATGAASLFYVLRARELLSSPWNPHVLVLPLMALAVVSAVVASGRTALLPIVALLASFVVQTHVAVVPVALVLSAFAVAAAVTSLWRAREERTAVRPGPVLVLTALAVCVMWSLPFIEELRNRPGNLIQLWDFFTASGSSDQPFRSAAQAWMYMVSGVLRPDFSVALGNVFRRNRLGWPQTVALTEMVVLVAVAVWSARTNRRLAQALSLILGAASVVALWSATRIAGEITDHEVFWISGLGALIVGVALYAAITVTDGRSGSIRTAVSGRIWQASVVLFVAGLLLTLFEVRRFTKQSNVSPSDAAAIQDVAVDIQNYMTKEHLERPLILIDQETWAWAAGSLLQMQKSGYGFAVEHDWLPMFVGDVVPTGRETVAITIAGRERHFRDGQLPGKVVISEHAPVFAYALRLR